MVPDPNHVSSIPLPSLSLSLSVPFRRPGKRKRRRRTAAGRLIIMASQLVLEPAVVEDRLK
jgi:hypothetical protein